MSAVNDLLLATNNSKKLKEIQSILGSSYTGRVLTAADFPALPEPEETGSTFQENAQIKADYYASRTGLITLADDSGLEVDAMDKRPGVFSARYAPTDELRISKLLEELKDVEAPLRTARFVCSLWVTLRDGQHLAEQGTLEGAIGYQAAGEFGFGYDPIFIVAGGDMTLAQFSPGLKNVISHRAVAMKKLRDRLLNALKIDS